MLYRAIIIIISLNILHQSGRSGSHPGICTIGAHIVHRILWCLEQLLLRILAVAVPAAVGLANFGSLLMICLYRHVLRRLVHIVSIVDI